MHDHGDHMLPGAGFGQREPDRHLFGVGDVEVGPRQRGQPIRQLGGADRFGHYFRHGLFPRQHHLMRPATDLRIDGAQRFVPVDHIGDGGLHGRRIESAGQRHRGGDGVGSFVGCEPVAFPQPQLPR